MTHATVLVVDDELPILDLLQEVLEDAGYAVVTATDGVTALELVRTVQPALGERDCHTSAPVNIPSGLCTLPEERG